MKRLTSVFIVIAVLMTLFCATASASTQYAMCSTPTRDGTVYIRTGAGVSYPATGVVYNGDTLIILQKGSSWHKVHVIRTGLEGWMSGQYITFLGTVNDNTPSWDDDPIKNTYTPDASVRDTDTMINRYGIISSSDGYANLRWGPATSFGVIAKVYNSTQVSVLEENGNWYRCEAGAGRIGYINKNLVKLSETAISKSTGMTGVVRSSDGYASIRNGAGTNYAQLYTLNVGNTITAYGASGDWLKVSSATSWTTAYIHKNLVRFYSAAQTTGNVNLRKGPAKTYDIIRALPSGTKVTLLATDGSFCRVDTGSEIAFLSAKYIQF